MKPNASAFVQFDEAPLFLIEPDDLAMVAKHHTMFLTEQKPVIDARTWKDLDLDELYTQMNQTSSGIGDYVLYAMMHQPCIDEADLQKRIDIMDWAKQQVEEREAAVRILSKGSKIYLEDSKRPIEIAPQRIFTWIPPLFWGLMIVSLMLLPFAPFFLAVFLCTISVSSLYYFLYHKKLEHDLDPLVYLVEHIEVLHQLAKMEFTGLKEWESEIKTVSDQLKQIRKSGSLSYFEDTAGLLNPITQKESRFYYTYASYIYEHQDMVLRALYLVGTLDACISAASYQKRKQANTEIHWKPGTCQIQATDMIHPLVEHCISNPVDLSNHQMLTGSNATGKSTYLKMVACNALLAQAFGFVFASSYEADFFHIATSMNIHDHLAQGESTFVAEGKAMKQLLDLAQQPIPCLCVIDEILRGTNTLDRISASAALLREFTRRNARCVIATHDMELTHLLSDSYTCMHFSETMKEGKMLFDYRLHPGVTTTRNAIDLLQVFAYDKTIIEDARRRLAHFETTGAWEMIP